MKDWGHRHSSSAAPCKTNLAGNNTCARTDPAGKVLLRWERARPAVRVRTAASGNWAAYSFSGSQGGDPVGLRRLAVPPLQGLPAPSCPNTPSNAENGDWIETASSGDLGSNAASAMKAFIDAHPLYDDFQHVKSGPGNGAPEHGSHQVINVFPWDCAESFSPSASAGAQWSLGLPTSGSDCSKIHQGNDTLATDRVHVLTVVPFTFYRGLVSSSKITGFWGGEVVSDPGVCRTNPGAPGCVINPIRSRTRSSSSPRIRSASPRSVALARSRSARRPRRPLPLDSVPGAARGCS
jgi:hypothetical protein